MGSILYFVILVILLQYQTISSIGILEYLRTFEKAAQCPFVLGLRARCTETISKKGLMSAPNATMNCLVAKANMVTTHLGQLLRTPNMKILSAKEWNRKMRSRSAVVNVGTAWAMNLSGMDQVGKDRDSEYSHTP